MVGEDFLTTELTGAFSHRSRLQAVQRVFQRNPAEAAFGSSVFWLDFSLLWHTEGSLALWMKLFTHHGAWLWLGSWSGLQAVAAVRCCKRHSCLRDPALTSVCGCRLWYAESFCSKPFQGRSVCFRHSCVLHRSPSLQFQLKSHHKIFRSYSLWK